MDAWLSLYVNVLCLGLLFAGLMFLHAREHERFHHSRWHSPPQLRWCPQVTLFVPCKGVDLDQNRHVRALFAQRYPRYRLCFIVEHADEPVLQTIALVARDFPAVPWEVVLAGQASDSGQKVHNLIAATHTIPAETDVLAFIDSDACPHPDWLTRLVNRLEGNPQKISTGYRWYTPVRPTWPNFILSAINNLIAGLMGSHRFNLVWGGAWAIRAETFRQLGLPEAWRGSLSDDLILSRLVYKARLKVAYEPHCLVTSPADFTWLGVFEFLRRQYLITRVYAPVWWWGGLLAAGLTNLGWGLSLGLTVAWAFTSGPWWFPLGGGLLLYALTGCRAAVSNQAIRPFVQASQAQFHRVARWNLWGWPVVSLVNALGLLGAAVGRTLTWRGIRYRLHSAERMEILSRHDPRPVELLATDPAVLKFPPLAQLPQPSQRAA